MAIQSQIPATQHAVQLVAPGQLRLNRAKLVPKPRPHEILVQVEAVGLCFSDLKLLKQFDRHARKGRITSGLDAASLDEIQSYVPDQAPTVPGHEVVCRIVKAGAKVKQHKVGQRCLVQADWRNLQTDGSNAAFGYNFEGGLQEFVVLDERTIIDSNGQHMLLPVGEQRSASAVALVEPWACVEDSYINHERQYIKKNGRLLVIAEPGQPTTGLEASFDPDGKPLRIIKITPQQARTQPEEEFDDIVYFGADATVINVLNDKLASGGIINLVLCTQSINAVVEVGVGRIHYGLTRWIGTTGFDAYESYQIIPRTGEIRDNERLAIVGAGGPMGQMHVIRSICSGRSGLQITALDVDDGRLNVLQKKVQPMAQTNLVGLELINTKSQPLTGTFSYMALMAPVAALVAEAIKLAAPGAIINLFAGVPAHTKHPLDLDMYIQKKIFMFGTSGSTIEDMKIVLKKVEADQLDTNASVDAISGMAGAADGIAAVENRTLAGKIIVYPSLANLGLIALSQLKDHYPTVAASLNQGRWCKEAEQELLLAARS